MQIYCGDYVFFWRRPSFVAVGGRGTKIISHHACRIWNNTMGFPEFKNADYQGLVTTISDFSLELSLPATAVPVRFCPRPRKALSSGPANPMRPYGPHLAAFPCLRMPWGAMALLVRTDSGLHTVSQARVWILTQRLCHKKTKRPAFVASSGWWYLRNTIIITSQGYKSQG